MPIICQKYRTIWISVISTQDNIKVVFFVIDKVGHFKYKNDPMYLAMNE